LVERTLIAAKEIILGFWANNRNRKKKLDLKAGQREVG
jgi:hypothetical protein